MPDREEPGFPPTIPMKASGPFALPPPAAAPPALEARAPTTRSPVRDRLIDERMIIFLYSPATGMTLGVALQHTLDNEGKFHGPEEKAPAPRERGCGESR